MPETQDHENDEPIDQHDSADPTVVPSSELSEPVVPEPPTVNEQDSALTHTADTERSDDTEPDDEAAQKEAAALLAAQHAAAQAIEEALAAERQHEVRGNEDLDVTVRVRHDDSPAVPEDHSTETKPEPPAAKPKPKAEETDEADNVDKADTQDDDSGTKNDSAESDDDTATHEKHTDSGSKTTKNNDQDDSPATETIEPVAPAPPRTPSAEVDSDTPGNSDENPEQPDSPDVDTGTAETDAREGAEADLGGEAKHHGAAQFSETSERETIQDTTGKFRDVETLSTAGGRLESDQTEEAAKPVGEATEEAAQSDEASEVVKSEVAKAVAEVEAFNVAGEVLTEATQTIVSNSKVTLVNDLGAVRFFVINWARNGNEAREALAAEGVEFSDERWSQLLQGPDALFHNPAGISVPQDVIDVYNHKRLGELMRVAEAALGALDSKFVLPSNVPAAIKIIANNPDKVRSWEIEKSKVVKKEKPKLRSKSDGQGW